MSSIAQGSLDAPVEISTVWARRFALSFLVWGAAAVYTLARGYTLGRIGGLGGNYAPGVSAELRALLIWALATPLIVALAHRYPLERGRWRGRLSMHVAASVVFVYLLQVGVDLPRLLSGEWGLAMLMTRSAAAFVTYYHLAGMVYGIIVATVLVMDARGASSRHDPERSNGVERGAPSGAGDALDDDRTSSVPVAETPPVAAPAAAGRLAVKVDDGILVVDPADIAWIDADGDYVRLHTEGRELLLRDTLTSFAARLDPARFARIHRSTIVNLDRVRSLHPHYHGDYAVVLDDGTELRLSRTRREALARALGHPL